ncbi:MAG TPA: ABC transporter ATP-binding protein [Thermohalobaculum sp.]|nr:ABC transporter ATP-binding protein [Thermohalobaculum sp.]
MASALPITIRNVTKSYGAFKALDDVSLDVRSGEFITLLGPSGSGKTTLLMTLAGFTRPDAGSVRFGEDEILLTPPHRRGVGMVFQNYALFPHMTVGRNVAYPLKLRKVSKADVAERVGQALDLVQLGHLVDRDVSQLSGGQKQRVALARAVVFEPRVLLMDEPLSALDKKLREQMQIEIRHLHEQLGMTTVYVTHDQREALTMSDRIAVINDGRIVQLDDPETLYERPRSRFVADFIGESYAFPVQVDGQTAAYAGRSLTLAGPPDSAAREQLLVVRPEKLRLLAADEPAGTLNVIEGMVREKVYQGESLLLYVDLPDGTSIATRQSTQREVLDRIPETGQPVRLGIDPQDTLVVPAEDRAA